MNQTASTTPDARRKARVTLTSKGKASYLASDGRTMAREEGFTPNGNEIAGRWVLRDQAGAWLDVDTYRVDLAERHDMHLVNRHGPAHP